ncbi:hypothetical protein K440DRAFT_631257 [Wilcoxina mikolae CBS 423.85]|nr:hypothetical protein K440DRAFT_631257 [Wilcoxina mikolae CBS 423.85]
MLGKRISIGGAGSAKLGQQQSWDDESTFFDPWVETLFVNTLRDTGMLALAWEASVTYVFTTHYAKYQGVADVNGDVKVRMLEEHVIPRQWQGLAVVLGVVALHLALLLVVGACFARSKSFKNGLVPPGMLTAVESQRGEKTD